MKENPPEFLTEWLPGYLTEKANRIVVKLLHLKNRTQTTQVGHRISDKAVVGCGVPQGSILGL